MSLCLKIMLPAFVLISLGQSQSNFQSPILTSTLSAFLRKQNLQPSTDSASQALKSQTPKISVNSPSNEPSKNDAVSKSSSVDQKVDLTDKIEVSSTENPVKKIEISNDSAARIKSTEDNLGGSNIPTQTANTSQSSTKENQNDGHLKNITSQNIQCIPPVNYNNNTKSSRLLAAEQSKLSTPSPIAISYQQYKNTYKTPIKADLGPVFRSIGSSLSFMWQQKNAQPTSRSSSTQQQNTYRELIFLKNVELINNHNSKEDRHFNMGLNQFTDLTQKQFAAKYITFKISIRKQIKQYNQFLRNKNKNGRLLQQKTNIGALKTTEAQSQQDFYTVPPRILIDWRCHSLQIRSQHDCSTSYAATALHVTQVSMRIVGKEVPSLSILELIRCSRDNITMHGCEAGEIEGAFSYLIKKGVGPKSYYNQDTDIPFSGEQATCNLDILKLPKYKEAKVFIKQAKTIPYGDCKSIVQVLKTRAVAAPIAGYDLAFYQSGTFVPKLNMDINHIATIVGYHPQLGYLMKNSWGKKWGMQGYAYLSVKSGVCKFAMYPQL